jgi:hypothetical protein
VLLGEAYTLLDSNISRTNPSWDRECSYGDVRCNAVRPGVAIREALLKGGEADYLLFSDGKAIATVEAKPEGYTLVGVEGA